MLQLSGERLPRGPLLYSDMFVYYSYLVGLQSEHTFPLLLALTQHSAGREV
jgi:hypothetical protein